MDTVCFSDGLEALRVLDGTSASYDLGRLTNYYYRGQRDADWPLVPSILRASSLPRPSSHGLALVRAVIVNEFKHIRQFATQLNKAGYPIYGSMDLLNGFTPDLSDTSIREDIEGIWPRPEDLDLMSLAQHYGLPTRLLDFTALGRIALFFAAWSSSSSAPPTDFAVWAIPKELTSGVGSNDAPLQVIHTPTEGNPHIRAQGGLFVKARAINRRLESGESLDVAEILRWPPRNTRAFKSVKLVIESSQRQVVLEALSESGVDQFSVFPSLDRIAFHVQQQNFP